ncbi:acyl carrier protein phosphodiesterase [Sinomicrobium sp.]
MNFLAHIYLSGDDELIRIGNFIADGIKGKKYRDFPAGVQKGILLHRQIDTFTDQHPIVRQSTKRLHSGYSHYSGVIVDMFYDHFLSVKWKNYSDIPLEDYVRDFYNSLQDHYDILPERTKNMMPMMIRENWLCSYASTEGLEYILEQMNRRTKNRSQMQFAIRDLKEYYALFEEEFTRFFNELIKFAKTQIAEIEQQF